MGGHPSLKGEAVSFLPNATQSTGHSRGGAQPGLPKAPCRGKKSFRGKGTGGPSQEVRVLGLLEAITNRGPWGQGEQRHREDSSCSPISESGGGGRGRSLSKYC